jgi:hypothetical protein
VIPALEGWKQQDYEFEASLDYSNKARKEEGKGIRKGGRKEGRKEGRSCAHGFLGDKCLH